MRFLLPAAIALVVLGLGQFTSHFKQASLEEVVDGDTINTDNATVRFLGVDTPEISSRNIPSEYGMENDSQTVECLNRYGNKASEFVKNSTPNDITLLYDRRSNNTGTYGRKLAYIQTEGDITRKLIVKGLAGVYYSKSSRINEFKTWERIAKENNRGIWSC